MKYPGIFVFAVCLLLQAVPGHAGGNGHTHTHELAARYGGVVAQAGTHAVEMVLDARHGVVTLYSPSLETRAMTATVTPVDDAAWNRPFVVVLQPLPFDSDPAGRSSRFVGSHAELGGIERFHVTLSLDARSPYARFEFNGSGHAQGGYICPMRCDRDRIFDKSGSCPVCGMQLKRVEEAHGNHDPRHGGQMFMAGDQWHHLEGTIVGDEFRLYFYNDFVEPLGAAPFADRVTLLIGTRSVTLELDASGDYLIAPLPSAGSGDRLIVVEARFPGRDAADRFDFVFASTQH